MDEDGWVPIHLVAGFKMVGKLRELRAEFSFFGSISICCSYS